ncbi:MAG: SIMPL domain-containing protein [Planctomycetota bacterium]
MDLPTLIVTGAASVNQKPSLLVMIGSVSAEGATLELALQILEKKRESILRWLGELDANPVEFGVARFADQADLDPMMASRIARSRVSPSNTEEQDTAEKQKAVAACYSAVWNIENKSAEEIMIFLDRVSFESQDLQEPESPESKENADWNEDPMQQLRKMQSMIERSFPGPASTGTESQFLFVSRLSEEKRSEAVRLAFDNAEQNAETTSTAIGRKLGPLKSLHGTTLDATENVRQSSLQAAVPMLGEVPFRLKKDDVVSLNPRVVEFNVSLHATFALEN